MSLYGARQFSFAVISDTHLNEADSESNSPFGVNAQANSRYRHIVDDLNTRELTHVIHLGDVVHPVPAMHQPFEQAAGRFKEISQSLRHPIHLIPGNHDVGDKPYDGAPSGRVRESYLDMWSDQLGEHYFCLRHQKVAFVGINSQIFGSGVLLEDEQWRWLEDTLIDCHEERIFLFSHYPPFLLEPDERENYDNLGEPSRTRLLGLIKKHSVEALFTGHVHHFWYNRFNSCHCYLLPSTAFARQDYSEMFRVAPPASSQFGRDDRAKLGYLLVHVYQSGHEIEFVRSYGENKSDSGLPASPVERPESVTPASNRAAVIGFDMREDWQERIAIPPSGGLDEFDRKFVRNDYPFLALWEMGARHLKIPLSDLFDARYAKRLYELHELGFRFTLYSYATFSAEVIELVAKHRSVIDSWEITGLDDEGTRFCDRFRSKTSDAEISLYYSPLRTRHRTIRSGETYYHVINHGFTVNELNSADEFSIAQVDSRFDGVVVRLSLKDSAFEVYQAAASLSQTAGFNASVHLRLRNDDPASNMGDERLLRNRLFESMLLSKALSFERTFSDTLADRDRGYFPRTGLVDGAFNPKEGAQIVKCIHAILSVAGECRDWSHATTADGASRISLETEYGLLTGFILPSPAVEPLEAFRSESGRGRWIDWETGTLVDEMPSPNIHVLPQLHLSK